jgi:3-oxoacyl-[acyl-carrier-protein] synthase II
MGIVSPLGLGVAHVWKRLVNGESGLSAIQSFDLKDLPAKVAGQVPNGAKADGKLDLNEWIPIKDQKKMDRFIQLAVVAAAEAVEDSGWVADTEEAQCRTGVMIGSGIGGLATMEDQHSVLMQSGNRRISPFFIPMYIADIAAGVVSMRFNAKGPNFATMSACATSAHAIGEAFRTISYGDADVMLCGGTEASVLPMAIGGFGNMEGTIIAGILVGIIEAFTVQYLGSGVIDLVVFVLLLIMLVVKPTGLIAERREENV